MKETAQKITNFMDTVEKLCLVNRDNLLSNGRQESDADHIMKLAYLVIFVSPYIKRDVDIHKMLEMVIVHDLAEAYFRDIPLSEQHHNPDLKAEKKVKEREGIEYYKTLLPQPIADKVYDLFMEYEQRQTIESKIVWCLDKLEANFQANRYNDGDIRYWEVAGGGDWYYRYALRQNTVIDQLDEEILSELQSILINLTKNNMNKHNIPIPKETND